MWDSNYSSESGCSLCLSHSIGYTVNNESKKIQRGRRNLNIPVTGNPLVIFFIE